MLILLLVSVFATLHSSSVTIPANETQKIECAFCGLAVNAVQGWLAENISDAEIINEMDKWCSKLPSVPRDACDKVAEAVPEVIQSIELHHSVSSICIGVDLCPKPDANHTDMVPAQHHVINLDLPPKQRWTALWSMPVYKDAVHKILNFFLNIGVSMKSIEDASKLGELMLNAFPEDYADEVRGAAEAIDIPVGIIAFAQLGYELSDACTSIVAQSKNGEIYHARNLDFGIGLGFTEELKNMTVQLEFQKGGKTAYHMTTYVGFIGALTGVRPDGFGVTINTRFNGGAGPFWKYFMELAKDIAEHKGQVNAFLLRDALATQANWKDAVNYLSTNKLIDPVYFTVSGTNPGEGAVITRDPQGARQVRPLNLGNGTWFVLETNYDWWNNAPWFDDRRDVAVAEMNKLGQADVTLDTLLGVLSVKPVLNSMTTYTILAKPKTGELHTFERYCNDPCPS